MGNEAKLENRGAKHGEPGAKNGSWERNTGSGEQNTGNFATIVAERGEGGGSAGALNNSFLVWAAQPLKACGGSKSKGPDPEIPKIDYRPRRSHSSIPPTIRGALLVRYV